MTRRAVTSPVVVRATTLVALLSTLLGVLLAVVAGPASADADRGTALAGSTASPTSASAATASEPADPPTVLVGLGGLRWNDVSASGTPTLWNMIGAGSVASINVKTANQLTCPLDAWLTLSAGRRMSATPPVTDEPEQTTTTCQDVPRTAGPTAPGSTPVATSVPGWVDLTTPLDEGMLEPTETVHPGTLGTALTGAASCATAVGPGAAVMLADADGQVDRYVETLDALDDDELAACPTLVVDLGDLPDSGAERSAALTDLDDTLARLTATLPAASRVLVAGVTATPLAEPDLQVVVDWTSGESDPRWLTSEGTRRPGLVQLADLTATVADDAGATTEQLDGYPLEAGEQRRTDVAGTVENRKYLNVLTATLPRLMPALVSLLALALVCAVGGTLLVRRRAARRGVVPLPPGSTGRRVLVATSLLVAAAPVAASLATLSRWWVQPAPTFVLVASLCGAAVVVAVAAWLLARLLPPSPWRLATTLGAITWAVLTIDGITGTTLQQGSLLGSSLAQGARFYGFNNMTFAVYAVGGLVTAAGVASSLRRAGHPRTALAVVVGIGAVTTMVDGWPAFGADFGGIVALVPGFAVLALLVAGIRITWRRVLVVALSTALLVTAVAVLDWLAPGPPSHLGAFVQRVLDGEAVSMVSTKAAGAWATVANPAGVPALALIVVAILALLRPVRWHLPEVADAYARWSLLRPLVLALITTAVVGSVLNDSGIVVGGVMLVLSTAVLVGSLVPLEGPEPTADDDAAAIRRMPTAILATGGGLLVALLLVAAAVPPAGAVDAGRQVAPSAEAAAVAPGDRIVVVGTAGLRWSDVRDGLAPTLRTLLTEDAGAAGDSLPTGRTARCTDGGWLALSAGRLTEVTDERADDGAWACPDVTVTTPDGRNPTVEPWSDLVDLQHGSSYEARLGVLGDTLAQQGRCATAVGPGAALALARPDGTLDHYVDPADDDALATALSDCDVTVVDAGDVSPSAAERALPSDDPARVAAHSAAVATVDDRVAQVLARTPSTTTVLVVDVSNTAGSPPSLGVTVLRPGTVDPDGPRYLTSSSTRTDGVVRILDVPSTILAAADLAVPPVMDDTPLVLGSTRPSDAATTADELAGITDRDVVRRASYVWFVDAPFYAGLALAGLCLLAGPWSRRTGRTVPVRARRWAEGAALALAAVPTAAFLVSLTGWWQVDAAGLALAGSTVLMTAALAGLAALAPRRPVWAGPAVLAWITFVVLTVDALVGTPLNRVSPLGSAPTYGARFYGFGNPTFSVYAVAAVVAAAALAQWLVQRGRRRTAAVCVGVVGVVAMLADVGPTWGADLGGGLVLAPTFAVLVLAASGARITIRRFVAVGAVGVLAVAAIGVLDWLRPAADRSHLGRFVGQVVDGEAWGTILRKAGYAARSILGGMPVWLTVVVLVLSALVLFAPQRFTPVWFARTETGWPLVRAAVLAMWVMAVAGSFVNDFGLRIAMIAVIPAVPILTVTVLRAVGLPAADVSDGSRSSTPPR